MYSFSHEIQLPHNPSLFSTLSTSSSITTEKNGTLLEKISEHLVDFFLTLAEVAYFRELLISKHFRSPFIPLPTKLSQIPSLVHLQPLLPSPPNPAGTLNPFFLQLSYLTLVYCQVIFHTLGFKNSHLRKV